MVQVLGAPPVLVTLEEAGLRVGTRSVVSEGGLGTKLHGESAAPTYGYQPPDLSLEPPFRVVDLLGDKPADLGVEPPAAVEEEPEMQQPDRKVR